MADETAAPVRHRFWQHKWEHRALGEGEIHYR